MATRQQTKCLLITLTAIICANDIVAYGVIKRLNELNIKVPEQIAVCGYDDLIFSEMATVPLTTVRQDTKLLGVKGVELLLKEIKGNEEVKQIVLKPTLIRRSSTK